MDETARLSLPFIMPQQAQKHVTHNEALQALDALVQPVVQSRAIAAPSPAPVAGEAYIVPLGATGSSWTNAITVDSAKGGVTLVAPLRPATDNAMTLGASGARWSAVWAATGTIQTSDARQKTDIAPTDLGLDFILALQPLRYRWAIGGNENGAARSGRRTHYGLLAQQVKATLDDLGCADFAGHVKADPSDPDSEEGLRYDAFIAPLIAAVHTLAGSLADLEARIRS